MRSYSAIGNTGFSTLSNWMTSWDGSPRRQGSYTCCFSQPRL